MDIDPERELKRRFAEAVRLERIRANMTQPEFAKLVGVSLSSVQKWEFGLKWPGATVRRRLVAMYPRLRVVLDGDDESKPDEGGHTR